MNLPNLLLIGAPKCGTTSIYDWLVRHPKVSGGIDKELFYLMDENDWKCDPQNNWKKNGLEGYAKFFKNRNKYIVDGTTLTIYQKSTLEYLEIEKPKIICFIREPSARIYSTFKYFRDTRTVLPKDMTFDEFIKEVKSGNDFNGNNQLSEVIEQSKYHNYLEGMKDIVGEDNVLVLDFESIKSDKNIMMQKICDWLGIDSSFYDDFSFDHKNETSIARFRTLNKAKEKIGVRIKNKKIKDLIRPIYFLLNKKKPNNELNGSENEMKNILKVELENDYSASRKWLVEK